MSRVLITGAAGFVGRTLCEMLSASDYLIRAALRSDRSVMDCREKTVVGDIDESTDWKSALTGVDLVIHLAARTHVLRDGRANSDVYLKTNVSGTRNLVNASAEAGVHRFIYLSSIKVNGEQTVDRAFGPNDRPEPVDAYGASKWKGEQIVAEAGTRSGMEFVIVRSPLVYGAGVRANFLHLMQRIRATVGASVGRNRQPPQSRECMESVRSFAYRVATSGCSREDLDGIRRRGPVHAGTDPAHCSRHGSTCAVVVGAGQSTATMRDAGRAIGGNQPPMWFPGGRHRSNPY